MPAKSKFLVILALYFILQSVSSYSAEFYVSPGGNDTTGDGSAANPWKTPEFGAKQLFAGDTLLIHAGTYVLSQSNLPPGNTTVSRSQALVSPVENRNGTSAAPITIKGAGDGIALLDAGSSPQWPAVGTNHGDYLKISHLDVRGAAILWATTGSEISNSNLYGGIDTPIANGGDNFGNVLRVEHCNNCRVNNNRLHDNQMGLTIENSPLLMEYDSTNLIIENNDVYNSVGIGIRLKDNPESVVVRNNHIYNNYLSGIQGANQDTGNNITVHNNIIRSNNVSGSSAHGGISQLVHLNGWKIYNNTFVNNQTTDIRTKYSLNITDVQAWNNLHYNSNPFYVIGFSGSGATFAETWTYSNYNQFFGSSTSWKERNQSWTSLTNYSSATGFDANSIVANPGFVNVNGSHPVDFKRNNYPAQGRGGAYSSVIGAYENGNEVIGFGIRPEEPSNLVIQ